MNPILRAAANGLSRSRSEGQIRMEKQREMQKEKRRQEKEKRRIDALEREKKWMALEKVPGKKEEASAHEESAAEKFQKELCWCIQQLEMGLANMKPNPKQAQDVEKVLRTLKSPKAPIAKKRQVMRTTFGDYRSKMLQEEKKHASVMASKTNITKVAPNKINQATFFRKSSGLGLHQRSVSSPASYSPSLSPTKEEAGGSNTSREPSGKNNKDHGKRETSNNSREEEEHTVTCTKVSGQMSSENVDDKLTGEGDEADLCSNNDESSRVAKSEVVEGPHLQNILGLVEKESPTHSTVSTVSSESFNPPTTSSSSSLSSHEVTLAASQPPQSCQTFRFDFRIEEGENKDENESCKKEEAEFVKNKRNDDKKETEKEVAMPLTEEGNSPVIGGMGAKEGKKKKRNRKKRKKKESEVVGDEGNEKQDNKSEELTENQKETKSSVKLSLGGGNFKFNFDDQVKQT